MLLNIQTDLCVMVALLPAAGGLKQLDHLIEQIGMSV